MAELFRSQDMKYLAVTMTNEAAHATVRELGKLGKLHIIDVSTSPHTLTRLQPRTPTLSAPLSTHCPRLSPLLSSPLSTFCLQLSVAEKGQPSRAHTYYKKRVQDCLAMEKRLTQLKAQMLEYNIPLEEHPITDIHSSHADILEAARTELEPLERELVESVQFLRENRAAIAKLTERRQVLNAVRGGMIADVMRRSAELCQHAGGDDLSGAVSDDEEEERKVDVGGDSDTLHIRNVVVGTIATDQQLMFSRMLYRVSRGNAFARFKEIKVQREGKAAEVGGAMERTRRSRRRRASSTPSSSASRSPLESCACAKRSR